MARLDGTAPAAEPGTPAGTALPTGTVTFLFTDVEGSTRLLAELGAEGYAAALAEHRAIVRAACTRHGGAEVDTQGDAFFLSFPTAAGALAAAEDLTEALRAGPIRVRVGLHTGSPLVTGEGYVGTDVHRAARIAAAGHGGQVLLSAATGSLVDGGRLRDLGEHRFKDLAGPERVFQLGEEEFPPLATLYRTNLPVPATPFLGRKQDLAEVVALLQRDDVRLLTLAGPGGTGKTRLALQAAAAAADRFPDGIWWVPLAALNEPALAVSAVAQELGIRERPDRSLAESVQAALAGRRALLLLDNAEHLLPALAADVAPLLAAPGLTVLVTSRERLQLAAEMLYDVPALHRSDAVELVRERAAAIGVAVEASPALDELCRRLDELPLALELAAARLRTFSVDELLERIGGRLDLFKAGRDADARQRTLRATIEWSHALLGTEETALLRRLAVFAGGCTLEAATEVCDADPDTLEALIDKSLVRRRVDDAGESRYWMLEMIHEFAGEQLDAAAEADDVRSRHLDWYASRASSLAAAARAYEPRALARLNEDRANIRSALTWALARDSAEPAQRLLTGAWFSWTVSGLMAEGDAWSQSVLALPSEPTALYGETLAVAGEFARYRGDRARARELKERAIEVLSATGDVGSLAATHADLVDVSVGLGDVPAARRHAEHALRLRREAGEGYGIAHALQVVGYVSRREGRLAAAVAGYDEAVALFDQAGARVDAGGALAESADALRLLGDRAGARQRLLDAFARLRQPGDVMALAALAEFAGLLELDEGRPAGALTLLAWSGARQEESGFARDDEATFGAAVAQARALLDAHAADEAWETGRAEVADVILRILSSPPPA